MQKNKQKIDEKTIILIKQNEKNERKVSKVKI
jgi:hypothetical protein